MKLLELAFLSGWGKILFHIEFSLLALHAKIRTFTLFSCKIEASCAHENTSIEAKCTFISTSRQQENPPPPPPCWQNLYSILRRQKKYIQKKVARQRCTWADKFCTQLWNGEGKGYFQALAGECEAHKRCFMGWAAAQPLILNVAQHVDLRILKRAIAPKKTDFSVCVPLSRLRQHFYHPQKTIPSACRHKKIRLRIL